MQWTLPLQCLRWFNLQDHCDLHYHGFHDQHFCDHDPQLRQHHSSFVINATYTTSAMLAVINHNQHQHHIPWSTSHCSFAGLYYKMNGTNRPLVKPKKRLVSFAIMIMFMTMLVRMMIMIVRIVMMIWIHDTMEVGSLLCYMNIYYWNISTKPDMYGKHDLENVFLKLTLCQSAVSWMQL